VAILTADFHYVKYIHSPVKIHSKSFHSLASYGNMRASMYRLVFQSPTTARPPVTGDAACLLIGRAATCGLRLTEAGIHDQHAELDRRADGYFIRDLTTGAGVHVNGTVITDQRLTTGDEIEIGAIRFAFEVVHEPPPDRRTFDLWQFLGALIVVGLVAGQVILFIWILTRPHPSGKRTDIVPKQPVMKSAPATTTPVLPALTQSETTALTAPEILGRMLKIVHADRLDTTSLRITIKAQVGDPQLDPKAIAISVQCGDAIQWLAIPATWENFKTKELMAHVPAACAGTSVRTYYRNQPQDTVTVPPAQIP